MGHSWGRDNRLLLLLSLNTFGGACGVLAATSLSHQFRFLLLNPAEPRERLSPRVMSEPTGPSEPAPSRPDHGLQKQPGKTMRSPRTGGAPEPASRLGMQPRELFGCGRRETPVQTGLCLEWVCEIMS